MANNTEAEWQRQAQLYSRETLAAAEAYLIHGDNREVMIALLRAVFFAGSLAVFRDEQELPVRRKHLSQMADLSIKALLEAIAEAQPADPSTQMKGPNVLH